MTKQRMSRFLAPATLLLSAVVGFTGCESKGPAQQAGETIDKGVQSAKDAVNPPGPVEKAGRAADEALSK